MDLNTAIRTLGLTNRDTKANATKKYRRLAMTLHPNKNPAPNATQRFQKLLDAHRLVQNALNGTKTIANIKSKPAPAKPPKPSWSRPSKPSSWSGPFAPKPAPFSSSFFKPTKPFKPAKPAPFTPRPKPFFKPKPPSYAAFAKFFMPRPPATELEALRRRLCGLGLDTRGTANQLRNRLSAYLSVFGRNPPPRRR